MWDMIQKRLRNTALEEAEYGAMASTYVAASQLSEGRGLNSGRTG